MGFAKSLTSKNALPRASVGRRGLESLVLELADISRHAGSTGLHAEARGQ